MEKVMKDYLCRDYIWELFRILPTFGFFELEIVDGKEVVDHLAFSRNTDDEAGKKELFHILGKYPDLMRRIDADFQCGFGFDLKITAYV